MLTQIFFSGVLLGGVYVMLSLGLSLLLGVSKFINFAYGDFVMVGTYMAYVAYSVMNLAPYFSWPVVLVFAIVFGILMYGVVHRTIGQSGPRQVLITIGLSMVLQNVVLMLFKSDYKVIPAYFGTSISIFGVYMSTEQLVTFCISVVVTVLLLIFIRLSPYGRAMRAVGEDRAAASLMGINVKQVNIVTFCLATAMACLAGTLLMTMYPTYPLLGSNFNIVAWVCVVLGGIGQLQGALFAGFFIGICETFTGFYFGADIRQAVYYAIFILCVIFRPAGLFVFNGKKVKRA